MPGAEHTRVRWGDITVEGLVSLAVVGGVVAFVLSQLQPALLLADTTASGGDMGAQVWGPAYLRDHLLPHGRLSGWAPDWYAGFPAYTFYFPLPALLIVLLDVALPYTVAFKLGTVAGVLTLPIAAFVFGRLSRMRFPGPALLAVATVPFLFYRGYSIYGGNIPSTLAGEFSFSIALSFALLFLAVVARGLETGRHRALAAGLLALTALSHLLPTLLAVAGAGILLLLDAGRRRLGYVVSVGAVGTLLTGFWALPLLARLPYANDMGWGKTTEYLQNLFPGDLRWILVLAAAGTVAAVVLRRRSGLALVGIGVVTAVAFVALPEGRIWNARLLPFWYLTLHLLAAVGVAEVGRALGRWAADGWERGLQVALAATAMVVCAATLAVVARPLGALPTWFPGPATADASYIPGWVQWNYSGYERKAAYPEYKGIIDTMAEVGRARGCGRAHWEYEPEQDRFGTPMALMLLPYWTDGCIASMEGLYFESSATVPFHFLNSSELAAKPSNPQRDLPYAPAPDLGSGVRHLQLLGVRYYLAFSEAVLEQARAHPALTPVAATGQWQVFEVADAPLVAPLTNLPTVVRGLDQAGWLDVAVRWYTTPAIQDTVLAASGPAGWPEGRAQGSPATEGTVGSSVALVVPPAQPAPGTTVSNVRADDTHRVSFDVDRTGSPVLVKVSYFPNWKARGAQGPWRVTPNLMVVVPTDTHVELVYGWTPVDVAGWLLTLAGLAGLVLLVRRDPLDLDGAPADPGREEADAPRDREPSPAGVG